MKTSFTQKPSPEPAADPSTSTATAEAPASSSAVAVRESQAPALPTPPNHAQVEGEIDPSDLNMDRVNLVQKSGNLGDNFEPGSFVLAKEVVLAKKGESFEFVVLKIKKSYQEDLPYDPSGNGEMPRRFNTAQEVREAGGSLKWGDPGYYRDFATALVLIPAPEGITQDEKESKFIYEDAEGKAYALALWNFVKTGYTAAAKKIFTAGMIGHLKGGYELGAWSCGSELKSAAGNSWYQPVLKPAGKTTPEFQAFAKEVLSTLI
jgi:hypothetical protein